MFVEQEKQTMGTLSKQIGKKMRDLKGNIRMHVPQRNTEINFLAQGRGINLG